MSTLLEDLVIDRVDLCDEGANSEAFIELFKRKEQSSMDVKEVLSKMKPEHAKLIQDAMDASAASLKKAQDSVAAITKERDDAKAELEAAQKSLADVQKALDDMKEEHKPHPEGCDCPECRAKREAAAKDSKGSGNASFDQTETFKSMPKEVQDYLATLKTQKEAAESELRKSKEAAAEAEAVAKAESLKAIPVEKEKLVGILKTATPELIELLTVINTAIEGTVLGEVGKSASGSSDTGAADAWGKIDAKATELAKSKNITKAKAVSEVIKENPELYREYLEGGAN